MKTRSWLAAGTAAVLALGAGAGASASTAAVRAVSHPAAGHDRFHVVTNVPVPHTVLPHLAPGTSVSSDNWSGYAAVADKNVALRFAAADFNVPSINCANSPSGTAGNGEAQWVGLDGYSNDTVEQDGVAGYCTGGTATYYAWYETYPSQAVTFAGINPGDAMTASVYYNSSTRQYNMVLDDVTQGADVFNVKLSCPSGSTCPNASAEAISEVPGGGLAYGYDLTDYGMENFTGGAVTSRDGTHGTFAASNLWTSSEITMVDSDGAAMSRPSALQGGSAFSDTWIAAD